MFLPVLRKAKAHTQQPDYKLYFDHYVSQHWMIEIIAPLRYGKLKPHSACSPRLTGHSDLSASCAQAEAQYKFSRWSARATTSAYETNAAKRT